MNSFFCIMQSSNIMGMFFNFAALWFISEIDDVAFKSLAQTSFCVAKSISRGLQ